VADAWLLVCGTVPERHMTAIAETSQTSGGIAFWHTLELVPGVIMINLFRERPQRTVMGPVAHCQRQPLAR